MIHRIITGMQKEYWVCINNAKFHVIAIFLNIAIFTFILFSFNNSLHAIDQNIILKISKHVQNIVVFIPIFLSIPMTIGITQEIYYKERLSRNFETLLTTPLSLQEMWLSKTIMITIYGTVTYIIVSAAVLCLSANYFSKIYAIIILIEPRYYMLMYVSSISSFLATASIMGYLYTRCGNYQILQTISYILNVAMLFAIYYLSKYIPSTDPIIYIAIILIASLIIYIISYYAIKVYNIELLIRKH